MESRSSVVWREVVSLGSEQLDASEIIPEGHTD